MRSPLFCFFLLLCDVAQYAHSFQWVIDGVCSMSGSARSSLSIAQLKKAGADRSRGTIIFATPSLFVEQERRPFLQNVAQTLLISSSFFSSSTVDVVNAIDIDQPKVTHKVFMDVRISRADGSFYVRDDPNPSSTSSEPFYGTLVFGLFGDRTPIHVKRFLDYVDVPYDVDSPLPSYSRSKFNTLDASTGLLIGGTIPGLDATTLAGGTVLKYSGRTRVANTSESRLDTIVWDYNNSNNNNDNNSSLSRGGAVQIIEGYGFSTSIARILKSSVGIGYYNAKASESVIDVMEGINSSNNNNSDRSDVALVFDDANPTILRGIFTDADYIRLAMERSQTCDLDESVAFVAAPVSNFITPAAELICVDEGNTASQAVAVMTRYDLRHVVVVDKCGPNFSYDPSTKIRGVISMQDILRVIQIDERLTFNKLTQKYPLLADRPIEQMREEMKSRANKLASNEETGKRDIIRAGAALLAAGSVALFVTEGTWLSSHAELVMIGIFVLGYVGIIFEEVFEFNKAAVALLMSTGLWITYADFYGDATGSASLTVLDQLKDQLAEVSDICFFLLAASAIVEVVDAHQGFKVVTNLITTKSKKGLFWVIGFLTFFLSAILNNLTVTIVMVSLLRKLIPNDDDRRLFGAMVVVAANAGGVWTPIGDVTTTMLWINNQLSTVPTVTQLFLPSLACLVVSMFVMVQQVEEDTSLTQSTLPPPGPLATRGIVVFWAGIASLLAVPVFSELTGLPPYLAMLTGLGAIWTLTDIIHMSEEEDEMMVPAALAKLDTSGILFFLGILMSIGVLDKSGLLKELAVFLNDNLPSQDIIATVIGIASALIDNVPLVAATMGMYDLTDYGTDDKLWQLIALCAGTGGSILVIGSASGVALMGLEKVDFLWYAKKVTLGATIGYFAGIATYLLENAVLTGTLLGGGVVAP